MQRLHAVILMVSLLIPTAAAGQVRSFEEGSLIIPMDLDYQDEGMLLAFGLAYQLLLADVIVYWSIDPEKAFGETDFTASAIDLESGQVVNAHAYRAGPFIIDASQEAVATTIVEDWQDAHVTTVHRASAAFEAPVSRTLTAAPTIAVFADGNEHIAFDYLNAAAIPDSNGLRWPDGRESPCTYNEHPDVLCVTEVRGETETDHADGALFGPDGLPVYCQIMTMHWGVNERDEEVIAEFRAFLDYPTHLMAECQAVNAIENAVNGHFLTPNGYVIDDRPHEVEVVNAYLPFGQFDGEFETVGGSEPSYSLPEGDSYFDSGVVMVTEAGPPLIGTRDVWMTGYVDGLCLIDPKGDDLVCGPEELVGKVSYLGGHRYSTDTPISENPDSQGTRLFLNSLFEADCATALGQPRITVELGGPEWTPVSQVTVSLIVSNAGAGLGHNPVLIAELPAGAAFVAASPPANSVVEGRVTWTLGTAGPGTVESTSIIMDLPEFGIYQTNAHLDYLVGLNQRRFDAEELTTVYSLEDPNAPDDQVPGDDGEPDVGGEDDASGGIEDAGVGEDASGGAADGGTGEDDGGIAEDRNGEAEQPGEADIPPHDGEESADTDGTSTGGAAPTSGGCGCVVGSGGGGALGLWVGLAWAVCASRRRVKCRRR